MGFGGGNGFSPSRTIVEDSTKTGNDAGQKHQFTGSVEISGGPLKLDGASITPGGGGGTPGGSDTQVQYNDGGAFGGDAQFFYNDSTNALTVGGKLAVGSATTPAYLCHLTSSSEVILTLQGPGDVGIRLCADTDGGPGENDNPYIDWYQDGQQPTSRANRLATIAMVGDATNPSASFTGSLENSLYIDTFCPNAKHTNVRRFQIATDCKFNKWNNQPSPRQGSHTARMTIEGNRGFVGIGDNNAPTATLHVSSSQGTPLFRVDHTGTLGPDPILFVTGSGQVGIGTATPTQLLDVAGTANATALAIGGTAISSTAAELNLLDASTVTAPAEGVWTGVERVAVINIGATEYTAASHVLGVTLPDNAIITRAVMDVFQGLVGGATTIALKTTGNLFPAAAPTQIDFLSVFGGGNVSIAGFAAEQGIPLTIAGGKLNGASTLTFTVTGDNLTAGGINVYVYYIMGS